MLRESDFIQITDLPPTPCPRLKKKKIEDKALLWDEDRFLYCF